MSRCQAAHHKILRAYKRRKTSKTNIFGIVGEKYSGKLIPSGGFHGNGRMLKLGDTAMDVGSFLYVM